MAKQLLLGFGDQERPQDTHSPQIKRREEEQAATAAASVEEIAAALRPRVLAYLGEQGKPVGIHELRSVLGHPALDTDPDPQSNPVNRILTAMRDRGELICHEGEWGEPSFELPARQQIRARKPSYAAGLPTEGKIAEIAAAARQKWPQTYHATVIRTYGSGRQVEVLTRKDSYHGRELVRKAVFDIDDQAAPTDEPAPGSFEHDVEQRFDHNVVQPVLAELTGRPWSTAEAIGNRALGRKRIRNVIATAADILRSQVELGRVQIAWDEQGMPHYALAAVPMPDHLLTKQQIDVASDQPATETPPPPPGALFGPQDHWTDDQRAEHEAIRQEYVDADIPLPEDFDRDPEPPYTGSEFRRQQLQAAESLPVEQRRLKAKTQVESLVSVLRRAKTQRNSELMQEHEKDGMWDRFRAREELDNRLFAAEDVGYVGYPYPAIYKRHLEEAVAIGEKRKGLKQRSRRMQSHLVCTEHLVPFVDEYDVAFLQDFISACKTTGIETRWIESGMEDYKRLHAANIRTPHELRSALRELLPLLTKKQEDDPVRQLEMQLIGRNIPGFFPTPRPIISRMLELAKIEPGERVLEPSAGKGDILDVLAEHHPDVQEVTAIEPNSTLIEILSAKGYEPLQQDFLAYQGQHDVIVMNPPFEHRQDQLHVQHAYEQLAAGGRLVAVMSAGLFFRSTQSAEEFRRWIEEVGAEVEDLPEDAFQGVEAFRQTGVRTKIVTIITALLPEEY